MAGLYALIVLLLIGLALAWRRIGGLETRLTALEAGRRAPAVAAFPAARAEARVLPAAGVALAEPRPAAPPPAPAAPPPSWRTRFEALIGGTLPIWIGGAALVLAAFFGVTYAVDQGWIGPATRTLLAAAFGLSLLAGSEAARALRWTREDPRLAQALAGAGVAVLYVSLYIGAAIYHLIGIGPAFVLLAAITLGAVALALRHGPATAIMALVGGFLAPLLAGFQQIGTGPLLVYLALLIGALFALALRRGWAWLALAAAAGGFLWVNILLVALDGAGAPGIGGFVLVLSIGASLAQPPAAERGEWRWLRLAPLVAGLLQLLVLAPALHFSALEWTYYLVLCAGTLLLAWRVPALLPGAGAALVLVLVLLALALSWHETAAAGGAAIAITLLFGGAGAVLSRGARGWALLALGGLAGPLLVADMADPRLLPGAGWAAAATLLALATAAIGWRHRDRAGRRDVGLIGGAFASALLLGAAAVALIAPAWLGAAFAAIGVLLALAGRALRDDAVASLPAAALLAAIVVAMVPLGAFAWLIGSAIAGAHLTYPDLPALADSLRLLAIPAAVALAGAAADRGAFGRARATALAAATALALLALYHLAKLPLAIGSETAFRDAGFIERAAISQALLAGGFLLRPRLPQMARALTALGLARIVWFDLLLLDPAIVPQAVGPLPLANAAVVHAALAAFWLSRAGTTRGWRLATLAAMLIAVLVAVRQATHGAILTGPITREENWLYSAALLLLSIAWLWRGIAGNREALRLAGLALLTVATLKVFLIDAAALGGLLRILSFLGLGLALIGIGWGYGRMTRAAAAQPSP